MIHITDRTILRSIQREAGRQADFYHRRGETEIANAWSDTEGLATEALRLQTGIQILLEGNVLNPSIIKPCEQGEQLSNHNIVKAFQ